MEYNNKKSGFSLAETMVALVIVALVLAAAAPLVAKKMTNDAKRYLYASGRNVFAAAGNNQVLNIGSGNSNEVKLNVNGHLQINTTDGDGNTISTVLTGDSIEIKNAANETIFNINSETGETNIEIAIPDYEHISTGTKETEVIAPSNGFVYISNATRGYTMGTCSTAGRPQPDDTGAVGVTLSGGIMNFNVKQEVADANDDDTDGNEAVAVSILPMLIPISEGQCYTCTNNVAVRVGGTRFGVDNETVDSEYTNRCYFIPLKHAVAEVIPAPAP